jgi:RNA polymerase sigma-70 factor (ECF subfamily)
LVSDFHLRLEEEIPKMMRYASALTRDPDDAADLVEDTVREALDHERARPGDLHLWLLTLLHDLRGNPFRGMALGAPQQRDATAAALTLSELDRALGQLQEEQRAVILLIGLEGLTYADTAAVMRVPVAALRSRLSRARAELRRLMGVAEAPRRVRSTARAA